MIKVKHETICEGEPPPQHITEKEWYVDTTYDVLFSFSSNPPSKTKKYIRNKNPTLGDIWFHHIKKQNIPMLEAMLNDKVIDINILNYDGDCALYYAVIKNNIVLAKFLIKNNADILNQNIYDEEDIFYECSYNRANLKIFSLIYENIPSNKKESIFLKENACGQTMINNLLTNGPITHKSIKTATQKVKYLIKNYPTVWEKIKKTKAFQNSLETLSEKGFSQFAFFLSGKEELKKTLDKKLTSNKTKDTKFKL